jgi:fructokinase
MWTDTQLNAMKRQVMRIGIDLGGTKIEGVVLDKAGTVHARERVATPKKSYDDVLESIQRLVARLEAPLTSKATVGIGTPGSLSPHDGLMQNCNNVNLNGQSLLDDLEFVLAREVRIANDADCFTLSEAADGAGQGFKSVFGVIIGTGTGGGFVTGGSLVTGPNSVAGEWGHNPLPWMLADEYPGPTCYCGKRGCLESYLSGPGLARDHQEHYPSELLEARTIAARAYGDPPDDRCVESMNRFLDRLARGLATVINTIDPAVIVLGGGLSNVATIYSDIPFMLGNYVFSRQVSTEVRQAMHGDSSGVRGAAWLWPA